VDIIPIEVKAEECCTGYITICRIEFYPTYFLQVRWLGLNE
jgi:hypothetical protein